MPDLRNKTEAQAVQADRAGRARAGHQDRGVRPGRAARPRSSPRAPRRASLVAQGTAVDYIVSKGPEPTPTPDADPHADTDPDADADPDPRADADPDADSRRRHPTPTPTPTPTVPTPTDAA